MINNFIAFDFETSYGHIPCSIGIVEFQNGIPKSKYYSLIRPIELKFSPINSRINRIYKDDVINEAEFDTIWKEIKYFFTDKIIVAHNASTDFSVLSKTLKHYNIPQPNNTVYCTLNLSKKHFKLPNYKLNTVAEYLGIDDFNHHSAIDDAKACGMIFEKIINNVNFNVKDIYMQKIKFSNRENDTKATRFRETAITTNEELNFELNGIEFLISGEFHSVSKNQIYDIIIDNGGIIVESATPKTNYCIFGTKTEIQTYIQSSEMKLPILYESDLVDFFLSKTKTHNTPSIKTLPKSGNTLYNSNDTASLKLTGTNIVISGVFSKFSRDEAKALIEANGGKCSGSVSSKTNYLLAGDGMGPAKLQKAESLGVQIISEDDFLKMIQTESK